MRPTRTLPFATLLLSALCALPASQARAEGMLDMIEHIFGATNIHAITGHGGTALGVSADGDASVLTWPSPSYSDQLSYISSNALDARSQPRLGAPEGAGAFLGLVLQTKDGKQVSWLRDRKVWTIAQDYGAEDGANIETRFEAVSLGLKVVVTDAIGPKSVGGDQGEVWVRRVQVTRGAQSGVQKAWLLGYANLAPTPPTSRLSELPIVDWGLDGRNDFAAVWDESAQAVVHFHPGDLRIFATVGAVISPSSDYDAAGKAIAEGTPDAAAVATFAADLDKTFKPGAYIAVTTVPAPDQHQVGYDATPLCAAIDALIDNTLALDKTFPGFELPMDPTVLGVLRCGSKHQPPQQAQGWKHQAADPLTDAADGELSGDSIAAGEVSAALRAPLAFNAGKDGESVASAAMVFGLGPTAATARAAMKAGLDAPAIVQAAQTAMTDWLAKRRLPSKADAKVLQVARRALINVRVGTDRSSGAIVASISRQPPYGLDWPRDGAFFDAMLSVSGQDALLDQRLSMYAGWQRDKPVKPTPLVDVPPPTDPRTGKADTYPAAAWEMNYYADGLPGGNIRFEIDNTGFALWTLVAHVPWKDPAQARAALEKRWPQIAAAADLLAAWKDEATGLHAPAQEDDNVAFTSTLHGAVTTFGALDIAGRAARLLGKDADALRWESRAGELREAILSKLYDPAKGRFVGGADEVFNPGSQPTGPTGWLVWPMRVLPWKDVRVGAQLQADLDTVAPHIELKTAGSAYFLKNTVAAAVARGTDKTMGPKVKALLTQIAGHATEGTHHFGEVMLAVKQGENTVASQRVANPHLWEGTLLYLTAMALEDPEALIPFDKALPASQVKAASAPTGLLAPKDEPTDDGGCAARPAGTGATWLWLLAAAALALWTWRRRQVGP